MLTHVPRRAAIITDFEKPVMGRRAFTFETKESLGRIAGRPSRNLFAINPKADFTVDGSDVVVIPFAVAFGEVLARETSGAIRG